MSKEDILNVLADPIFDNSVIKYQYHTYKPFSQATISNTDEIRMVIQHGDLYTLLCKSYISIEGHLTLNETSMIV